MIYPFNMSPPSITAAAAAGSALPVMMQHDHFGGGVIAA